MARTMAAMGSGVRLADYLSAGLLVRVMPAEVVRAVLDEHGCNSRRMRSFPAVASAYYCMALTLYPEAAYDVVLAAVAQGLAWAPRAAEPARVAKSSISGLRANIGSAPLTELVRRCCLPLADAQAHLDAFYRCLTVVAIDGGILKLPDEAGKLAHFSRTGSRTGLAGHPPGAVRRSGGVRHTRHLRGQPGSRLRQRVESLRAPPVALEAGHAAHGRPRLQRIRVVAQGPARRRQAAVALCEQPSVARPPCGG